MFFLHFIPEEYVQSRQKKKKKKEGKIAMNFESQENKFFILAK